MPDARNLQSYKMAELGHSDLEVRDAALDSFRDLVKTTVDTREVERWVSDSPVRQNLFGNMAVGTIRWPRSLGRPDAPNLSDGFVIRTQLWADVWHIGLDGSIVTDIEGWIPGVPPTVRDGLAEPDHYSVRYLFNAAADNDNQVEVQFSNVPWRHPGRSVHHPQLYLSSHGYQFYSGGNFTALPGITIDSRPFFHP